MNETDTDVEAPMDTSYNPEEFDPHQDFAFAQKLLRDQLIAGVTPDKDTLAAIRVFSKNSLDYSRVKLEEKGVENEAEQMRIMTRLLAQNRTADRSRDIDPAALNNRPTGLSVEDVQALGVAVDVKPGEMEVNPEEMTYNSFIEQKQHERDNPTE